MPRLAQKKLPSKPKRERGAMYAQALDAIALLAAEPQRPLDLMEKLPASRRTVERVLHGIQAAGLELEVERAGTGMFYRLKHAVLKARLGV